MQVYATCLPDPQGLQDTVTINLSFADGSTGTVAYFANGARDLPKEYVEVYRAGTTGILEDFRSLAIRGSGKPYKKKLMSQDKGQKLMVRAFVRSLEEGGEAPIPADQLIAVSLACFRVLDSLRWREALPVDWAPEEEGVSDPPVEEEPGEETASEGNGD